MLTTARQLVVETRAFFIGSYGFSCAYMRTPNGQVSSQGWVIGWDDDVVPPAFPSEFAILHGCSVVLDYLRDNTNERPSIILVTAGRPLEQARLLKWFCEGNLGLISAAASRIAELLRELAMVSPCPMIMSHTEWCSVGPNQIDRIEDPASVIEGTKLRLLRGILGGKTQQFLSRIPRIPLTCGEVKDRLIKRHEKDERNALFILAELGSRSGKLVSEWNLTRTLIKEVMKDLCFSRKRQVTLGTILTGTRFKCYSNEVPGLASTICRKCLVEVDNINHMLMC